MNLFKKQSQKIKYLSKDCRIKDGETQIRYDRYSMPSNFSTDWSSLDETISGLIFFDNEEGVKDTLSELDIPQKIRLNLWQDIKRKIKEESKEFTKIRKKREKIRRSLK